MALEAGHVCHVAHLMVRVVCYNYTLHVIALQYRWYTPERTTGGCNSEDSLAREGAIAMWVKLFNGQTKVCLKK